MTPSTQASSRISLPNLTLLEEHIKQFFVGKDDIIRKSITTFLAGGHLLIEDVPGVGKTTLALCLAKSVGCSFQRIQFTSDLLPSDILGVSMLDAARREFEFKRGPLFHQIILADEINRATPRTQSALLEAMNEHQVTVDNETYPLPRPFFVMATQNPHEHHGTFPLPESQLDRFMMRLSIGYPDTAHEKKILQNGIDMESLQTLEACLSTADVLACMNHVPQVRVSPLIDDYILALVQATRKTSAVEVGASPRSALALRRASQAHAILEKREYVTPDDVKTLAVAVLAHRLLFTAGQVSDTRPQSEHVIQSILQQTAVPL